MLCKNVTLITLLLLLVRESSFSGVVNYVCVDNNNCKFPYEGNSLQTSVPVWLPFS